MDDNVFAVPKEDDNAVASYVLKVNNVVAIWKNDDNVVASCVTKENNVIICSLKKKVRT